MNKFVFATNNPGKLKEIKALLKGGYEILSLEEADVKTDIPEDHDTFKENALQKAEFIYERTQIPVFADDSGIEVNALNGRPGVFSARYAGAKATPEDNIKKLLSELAGKTDRKAQFRTVIALKLTDSTHFFEGVCKGEILHKPAGKDGFGYDPVFRPEGYDQSFSEMSSEEKNKISHRGKAVRKLVSFLKGNEFA